MNKVRKSGRYTLKELSALRTIVQGQADDLKVEQKNWRVWLSRMTVEDGMPYNNQVTVEKFVVRGRYPFKWVGRWEVASQYQAK